MTDLIVGVTSNVTLYELRQADRLIAFMNARPPHCDRGRWVAMIDVHVWKSENDPWPRYYFDLERGKAEVEAYLTAKNFNFSGAQWIGRTM
jgi:hypothetical protein